MNKTISERMKEALSIRNMKQSELVEKTKIGKSSISTYLSGDYEPKQRNIYKLAEALDVNEAWLMGYDVPIDRIQVLNKLDVTNDELNLLNNYKKLNNLGKKEANKRVAELTEITKYTFTAPDTMAAHSDGLSEEIKTSNFNKIDKIYKNMQKK